MSRQAPTLPAPPPALSAVPSTLRIPLAARAFGDALFPRLAVGDVHARACLAALGDDGRRWLADRPSVYGTLVRTRLLRQCAADYLQRHPEGQVVNLGCGLSHYFQWLDNGRCRMLDADLPEVLAIRRRLGLPRGRRQRLLALDLRGADWWDRLDLPSSRCGPPLCFICEGVLMYLPPQDVAAVLASFGARAPHGSVLLFDALSALAVGQARWHPSVRQTGAEFAWGPARLADLTAPHARLQLAAVHPVMDGYDPLCALAGLGFRFWQGLPFYALYALRVDDDAGA